MSETRIQVHQSDAIDLCEKQKDRTVDVIITDPPYWTLDRWRNVGTTTRLGGHSSKDKQRPEMFFETIDQDYLWQTFLEFDRILKLDGHLYMFCDDRVAPILLHWIREAKDEHRFGDAHLLIWDKVNMGMGYHYRRAYECIVFAWREPRDGVRGFKPRRLRDLGKPDIIRGIKRIARSKDSYPTEKPPALIHYLVSQSARVGDTLFDPFAGSGVLGAATPLDYEARIILGDKSPLAIEHMKQRLAGSELFGINADFFAPEVEATAGPRR